MISLSFLPACPPFFRISFIFSGRHLTDTSCVASDTGWYTTARSTFPLRTGMLTVVHALLCKHFLPSERFFRSLFFFLPRARFQGWNELMQEHHHHHHHHSLRACCQIQLPTTHFASWNEVRSTASTCDAPDGTRARPHRARARDSSCTRVQRKMHSSAWANNTGSSYSVDSWVTKPKYIRYPGRKLNTGIRKRTRTCRPVPFMWLGG